MMNKMTGRIEVLESTKGENNRSYRTKESKNIELENEKNERTKWKPQWSWNLETNKGLEKRFKGNEDLKKKIE